VVEPAVEPPADFDDAGADSAAGSPQRAGTFALQPGETAYVTLRAEPGPGHVDGILGAVAPVVIPEAGKTYVAPLIMLPAGDLPPGRFGVSYSASLEAFGGKKPYRWSATLPAGLVLDGQAGRAVLSGVPLAVGRQEVAVQLGDGRDNAAPVTRTFALEVARARTRLQVDVPPAVQVGTPVAVRVTVVAEGDGTPSGIVLVKGGDGAPCSVAAPGGTCTLEFQGAGARTIDVAYAGDSSFEAAGASEVSVVVSPAAP